MDFEKSSIERLKRTLYSRNENIVPKEKRTPVEARENDAPTDWGAPKSFDISYDIMTKRNNSFFNKFLIGSLIFFVISLGIALFIFFGGINMISSNNLDIKIISPSSVSSGEELDMGLTVINSNRTDLEGVSLFIDYPEGSQTVGNVNKSLTHDKIDLGTIAKGASEDYTVRTLLFGEKDAVKIFTFRLEYKVKGSNAVFSKEKTYDISIGSSPLLLNVNYPKEVNSGQEIKISVEITSNSSVVMNNSLIKIEYPYGFTYKTSNIKPLRDNSVWNLGDLKNGDKKTLLVTGVLVGQNMEDRSFRISAGTESSATSKDFTTALAESLATIGIRKSFFDLEVSQASGASTSVPGESVPIAIKWQNTLPDKIVNSHIEATISGNAFDRNSVAVENGGFYRSLDNTVLWDKNGYAKLAEFLPGDSGQVSFSPSSLVQNQIGSVKNPHIDVHVVMSGDRSGTEAGPISSTADFTLKIASTLSFSAKSYRASGPLTNIGPIPPRADKESTYTITWTLTNTTNDLNGVAVSGTLPVGVEWKGQSMPVSEKISYDPDTRVVSWNASNISAGTGFIYSPRQVSFKVGIIPSINQVGLVPPLILQTNVTASDTYTQTPVSVSAGSVTTQYSDPNFVMTNATVVK